MLLPGDQCFFHIMTENNVLRPALVTFSHVPHFDNTNRFLKWSCFFFSSVCAPCLSCRFLQFVLHACLVILYSLRVHTTTASCTAYVFTLLLRPVQPTCSHYYCILYSLRVHTTTASCTAHVFTLLLHPVQPTCSHYYCILYSPHVHTTTASCTAHVFTLLLHPVQPTCSHYYCILYSLRVHTTTASCTAYVFSIPFRGGAPWCTA